MKALWWLRTVSMFIILTIILVLIGALVSVLFSDNWLFGLSVMMAVSLVMCFVSYFFSKQMALMAARAKIVSEAEYPRLYSIVRDVANRAGMPMPEVGISPDMSPNAFATGRNPRNAAIVCTRGILDLLPDDELRGVIAHEMAHIRNRDILLMSIASAIASIISYLARMLWWAAIFSGGNRNDNNRLVLLIVAIAAQILVPIAAILIQLGISRNREYLADETGARIIDDPRALARALDHLEKGNDYFNVHTSTRSRDRKNPTDDYAHANMWIADPLKKGGLISRLFSTHPPMYERIKKLNKLAEQMGR